MAVFAVHIALAIFLFYAVNWIGEHSSRLGYLQLSLFVKSDESPAFNFILKTLTPTVFVVIVAAICYASSLEGFVKGIWLVAVYYFLFRLLYNLVLGRALLLNWLSFPVQIIVGITTAYLAYLYLIVLKRTLLPDTDKIRNQIWIIIALFLYATFNNVRTSSEGSIRRKNRYLRSRYRNLKKSFGVLIENQFPEKYMELVAYAILITETFNRPRIAQIVERAIFPWGSRTLGPMQVYTNVPLSDSESVRKGVDLLKDHFESTKKELLGKRATQYEVIRRALAKYNRDEGYLREIVDLLHIMWAQVDPEYRPEFQNMYMSR